MGEYRLDWMISVDDHILEPPGVWQDRMPSRYRDTAPMMVTEGGDEFWRYEGRLFPISGLSAAAGKRTSDISPNALRYADMRPGCYDAKERIVDMDRAGVIASINFPSFPRFAGQTFMEGRDHELGALCVKAWNDWLFEEWCSVAPGRFIPATLIPFWDVEGSVAEIHRCVALGSRGIIFSENPAKLTFEGKPLPSIHSQDGHWDPIWRALEETELPLLMHYGSSSNMQKTADDAPYLVSLSANSFILPISTTLDWIFSGVLGRFPKLKLCMSESQIGWIAPTLERAEYVMRIQGDWNRKYHRQGTMADHQAGDVGLVERDTPLFMDDRSPSEIFADQIFACFFEDFAGVRALEGSALVNNIMIEMDYPHSDSTWPNSLARALDQVKALDEKQQWQVLVGNATRLHRFEPSYPAPAEDRI
jgi:predicted TIM-barrel fold metal-dependent hydrolase